MERKPYHTELHTANLIKNQIETFKSINRRFDASRWRREAENAIYHFALWNRNLERCFGPLPWLPDWATRDISFLEQRSGNYPPDPLLSDDEIEDFAKRILPVFETGANMVIEKAACEGVCDSGNTAVTPEKALRDAGISNGMVFR